MTVVLLTARHGRDVLQEAQKGGYAYAYVAGLRLYGRDMHDEEIDDEDRRKMTTAMAMKIEAEIICTSHNT